MFKLQPIRITRGDFLAILSLKTLIPFNRIVGAFFWKSFIMQNTTRMHSFNVNMHDANAIVKNSIPNISNKGQVPLVQKGYRRPILWINIWLGQTIPSLIQKENLTSQLDWYHMPVSPTFISAAWSSHASLLSKARLRFKIRESCSSMSVMIYLFWSSSIGSKFRTKS